MLNKIIGGEPKLDYKTATDRLRIIELLFQYDELDEMNSAHNKARLKINQELSKLCEELEEFLSIDEFIKLINSIKKYTVFITSFLEKFYPNDLRYIHDTLLDKYEKTGKINQEFFTDVSACLIDGNKSWAAAENEFNNMLSALDKWGKENPKIASNTKGNLISADRNFKVSHRNIELSIRNVLDKLLEYMFYFYQENTIKNCLVEHSLAELLNMDEYGRFDLSDKPIYLYIATKLRDVIGFPDKQ